MGGGAPVCGAPALYRAAVPQHCPPRPRTCSKRVRGALVPTASTATPPSPRTARGGSLGPSTLSPLSQAQTWTQTSTKADSKAIPSPGPGEPLPADMAGTGRRLSLGWQLRGLSVPRPLPVCPGPCLTGRPGSGKPCRGCRAGSRSSAAPSPAGPAATRSTGSPVLPSPPARRQRGRPRTALPVGPGSHLTLTLLSGPSAISSISPSWALNSSVFFMLGNCKGRASIRAEPRGPGVPGSPSTWDCQEVAALQNCRCCQFGTAGAWPSLLDACYRWMPGLGSPHAYLPETKEAISTTSNEQRAVSIEADGLLQGIGAEIRADAVQALHRHLTRLALCVALSRRAGALPLPWPLLPTACGGADGMDP